MQKGKFAPMNLVPAPIPDSSGASTPWLESFSFCPSCLAREFFRPADRDRTWTHCGKQRTAISFTNCPGCHRHFEFLGHPHCPYCQARFADGVPLQPYLETKTIMDRLLKYRGDRYDRENQQTQAEFAALYASWSDECNCTESFSKFDGTYFCRDLDGVQRRHDQLLAEYATDIEKFLYGAPIRLARFEAEYSWKFDQELGKEVDQALEGMLHGRHSMPASLPFLVRYRQRFPHSYSRKFLAEELKRRFRERHQVPRPGFQLTLEYARTLSGLDFEAWLARLLRDAGIPGVRITQASRDQGADLVITTGERKIVMQAKQYQDTIGNSAVQQAHGALSYYGATEAWVVTTSSFSKDAIDLAYRTGVRLVPGNQLLNLPVMLKVEDSNRPEPAVCCDHDVNTPTIEVLTEIAPAGKGILGESASANTVDSATPQAVLQKLMGFYLLGFWKRRQLYVAAGAVIVLLISFIAGLAAVRARRSGSQAGAAQRERKIRRRVPTISLPGRAPKTEPSVTLNAPQSEFNPGGSRVQDTNPTRYAPSKYSHWYTIEKANGEITVLNNTYTHIHVFSNAPVRAQMSDCQEEGIGDFECNSQAGMITVTDLSGSTGTRVLLELR
jgi:hypothetical protein